MMKFATQNFMKKWSCCVRAMFVLFFHLEDQDQLWERGRDGREAFTGTISSCKVFRGE
jgi:hypothetical protein